MLAATDTSGAGGLKTREPRGLTTIGLFATGHKIWLFSDTVQWAEASAVEPSARLRHVLTELLDRFADVEIDDLQPINFAKATTA